MSENMNDDLCPQERIDAAVKVATDDTAAGLNEVDGLLKEHPRDPRLHFFRGSLLATLREYDEGRKAMSTAIDIAPGFTLARYQLGFLHFTSGDLDRAESTWRPLIDQREDEVLGQLAQGLILLGNDKFEPAIDQLERSMSENIRHPAVNRDVALLVEKVRELITVDESAEGELSSATDMLLRQQRQRTRH